MIHKDNREQECLNDAVEILKRALDYLNVEELFELCRQASEKYLEPSHELYQYFHDENNIHKGDSD